MSKASISTFLGQLVSELEQLSEQEIAMLNKGEYSLRLVLEKNTSVKKPMQAKNKKSVQAESRKLKATGPEKIEKKQGDSEYRELLLQLQNCSKIEQGIEILTQHCKSKKQLEAFARTVHVHILSRDNVDKIREKIVDAIVGSRLNSDAIKNTL